MSQKNPVPPLDTEGSGKKRQRDEYDPPWKEMIGDYFAEFLAFFFPEAYAEIDWQRSYEALDKELHKIMRDAEVGRRIADKLVKVWLKDGEEQYVLIHVEVQGRKEADFGERMFVYNYRVFDVYRRPSRARLPVAGGAGFVPVHRLGDAIAGGVRGSLLGRARKVRDGAWNEVCDQRRAHRHPERRGKGTQEPATPSIRRSPVLGGDSALGGQAGRSGEVEHPAARRSVSRGRFRCGLVTLASAD